MSAAVKPHSRRLPSHGPTINECRHDHDIWSDLALQHRHVNCHHVTDRAELVAELHRKLNFTTESHYGLIWLSLKKWFSYDVTGSIIACSTYERNIDFIHCGYKVGPFTFACRDALCPLCSYNLYAKPLLEEFGGADLAGMEVVYVVISLSRHVDERDRLIFRDADRSDLIGLKRRSIVPPCSPEDYGVGFENRADVEQIRVWWTIVREEVRDFVAKGKRRGIRGALGGPELAVRFTPLRVLPHMNLILWADSFTPEDARRLRRLITKRMRDSSLLKFRLLPCVACYRLASPDDVRQVLKYSFKAIGLAGAYIWSAQLADYGPGDMAALNREVNTFLRYLPDVFHQLRRVDRHGVCHAGSKGYIGVITPRRAERLKRDAERRRAMRKHGSPGHVVGRSSPVAEVAKTILPRASSRRGRFAYWLAAVQPPPPPAPPTTSKS